MPNANDALAVAQQARAAAELLWLRGDREDALSRATHALETTLSVAPVSAALGPRAASLLRAAQLATMDAGARAEQEALVLPILREQRRAARRIARALETPAARRRRHLHLGVAVWCVVVAALAFTLYRPHGLHAHATATLARSDYFGASRALDGDPKTAWLLPDHKAGTLVIDVVPPRDVHVVTIAQPQPLIPRRATTNARVRLYRGGRAIAERRVAFAPSSAAPSVLEVAVEGRGVTRVEIFVSAWRGAGGGVAEVGLR